MAKQGRKALPARKSDRAREEDSLLIRSAESLGRVIGSLQRQVDGTRKRVADATEDAMDALPDMRSLPGLGGRRRGSSRTTTRKTSRKRTGGAARKTTARKATGRKSTSRKTSRKK